MLPLISITFNLWWMPFSSSIDAKEKQTHQIAIHRFRFIAKGYSIFIPMNFITTHTRNQSNCEDKIFLLALTLARSLLKLNLAALTQGFLLLKYLFVRHRRHYEHFVFYFFTSTIFAQTKNKWKNLLHIFLGSFFIQMINDFCFRLAFMFIFHISFRFVSICYEFVLLLLLLLLLLFFFVSLCVVSAQHTTIVSTSLRILIQKLLLNSSKRLSCLCCAHRFRGIGV